MLIDFLNGVADAMRDFEKLPEPVKVVTSALTGLTGAALLAGGTAVLAIPKWVAFREALSVVGVDVSALEGKMKSLGKYVGAVALAWGALKAAQAGYEATVQQGVRSQGELTNALLTSKDSVDLLMAAGGRGSWSEFWMGDGYSDTLEDLAGLFDRTGTAANNFFMHALRGTMNKDIAALDSLERLGESLSELSQTDLPQATQAFADLARSQNLNDAEMTIMLDRMPAFKDALVEQANQMGIAATDANLLKIATGEIAPESKKAADAAEQHAQSLEGLQGAAKSTSDEVKNLANEIRGFGSAQLDVEKASIGFYDALEKMRGNVESGAASLDVQTAAGRDTRGMLLDIATATNDYAAALADSGASTSEYSAVLASGREELVRTAEQLGMNAAEAQQWADALISAPETVETWVKQHGAQEALNELGVLSEAIPPDKIFEISADATGAYAGIDGVNVTQVDEKTAYVWGDNGDATKKIEEVNRKQTPRKIVTIDGDDSAFQSVWSRVSGAVGTAWVNIFGTKANANGGIHAYADGGISKYVQAFVGGGFPTGIYSGGAPIHKFAEPETRWEAYISGKAGQEDRNRQIWVEAGERLGMGDVMKAAAAMVNGGGAGGGTSVQVDVHPGPGMSEAEIGRIAAEKFAYKLKGA